MPNSTALLEFTVYCFGYITHDQASVLTEDRTNKSLYNYTLAGIEPAHLASKQGCNPLHQRGLRFGVYVYKDLRLYTLSC